MNRTDELHILAAGYSVHRKSYYMNELAGLDHYLIRIQTEGKAFTRCENKIEAVETGDLLLFAPGEPYELRIESPDDHKADLRMISGDYFIFLRGPWVDEWWAARKRPNKIKTTLSDGFIGLFRQITLEQQRITNPCPEISEYYMKILCLDIDRQLSERPLSNQGSYLAYQIKHFIEENAAQPFRLEDAAAHAGISVSRAVHLFKATFGRSIIQYALEVRLNMARERIMFSPLSLEHVAESSGFPSYNYFHKVFRAKFGMSPKQFRLASRENMKP
ncbi:AraC family transcriptional regulator [Paenibacillus sp. CAA11]|uniref:AraC family transcriptional regulator n=1 Tax=Paenibacillus sp. CAA11 TaxID=1532905 RepID=UPI000D343FB4|nr:AraC family transcriptional regulator [Paenibacillus sp. CAA11]AWB45136.1 AraC family transcriptional regulator [Paenibacillus sp. CAA11]